MSVSDRDSCVFIIYMYTRLCTNSGSENISFFLFFFRLAIVLSVLLFADSDYPFGIFKLFFLRYDKFDNEFINVFIVHRTSNLSKSHISQ